MLLEQRPCMLVDWKELEAMTDLKAMNDKELLAEYRVAAISCNNQFQYDRMCRAEQELLRRLQPEGQSPEQKYEAYRQDNWDWNLPEWRDLPNEKRAEWAEPQPQSAGPSVSEFWEKWHTATYGSSVEQYMEPWGWRTVAWKFAEAYSRQMAGQTNVPQMGQPPDDELLDKELWKVVPGQEDDDWGIRRVGEDQGSSIAQMVWMRDAKGIVRLHNQAQARGPQMGQYQELCAELYQVAGVLHYEGLVPTLLLDKLSAAARGLPIPKGDLLPFDLPTAIPGSHRVPTDTKTNEGGPQSGVAEQWVSGTERGKSENNENSVTDKKAGS